MRYRADIDGLRAVAILPVLFYHAGVPFFHGGYVGVDVFFVISGFLITGIIHDEVARRDFSIARFYERRARRIFPALFAVLACTLAAAAWLFLPGDLEEVARNTIATLLFGSNFRFYRSSGYFDAPAESNPLLHTWSLAVEEQFYILFPLFLLLAERYCPRWLKPLLALAALVSLAVAAWGLQRHAAFTFFMLPTRAWELAAGALLALGAVPAPRTPLARDAAGLAGLAAIAWPVFAYTPATPFPGLAALPPVLGAALLIHAGPQGIAGRLLSARPLVFIGLISYSLYLWHWPIIVFARYRLAAPLEGWTVAAVVAASALAAAASWRWIETIFRDRRRMPRGRIFALSAAGMAAGLTAAMAALAHGGWPGRFPAEVDRLASYTSHYSPRRQVCHSDAGAVIAPAQSCIYGAKVAPAYAIWGDSHAVELAYALGEVAARHGQSLAQMSYSSCPPAEGLDIRSRPGCRARNDDVLSYLETGTIGTVFLIARYDHKDYGDTRAVMAGVARAVARLRAAGKRVVLIHPVPTAPASVPPLLAHEQLAQGDVRHAGFPREQYESANQAVLAALDALHGPGIIHIVPAARLCPGSTCLLQAGGDALYFDDNHLSVEGARYLMPLFEPLFGEPRPTPGAASE